MNACCPTDTIPAYPASRFHMLAIVIRMKRLISVLIRPAPTRYGITEQHDDRREQDDRAQRGTDGAIA